MTVLLTFHYQKSKAQVLQIPLTPMEFMMIYIEIITYKIWKNQFYR